MLSATAESGVSTYYVEVSGWDSSQEFFVETCELKWSERKGKYLTLTRSLRPQAVIFVRLLLPWSPDQSSPVPYRTEYIGVDVAGLNQFRLSQVLPCAELEKTAS
jgi:hypothetical protein